MSDGRLVLAVAVNVALTVAQIVGGVVAGSLALVADALHNLSDAATLVLALFARRIGRRPADKDMTFGYGRAEVIAALINLVTLLIVGVYLLYEATVRFVDPQPVSGWIVVIVAGIALAVDVATAALTMAGAKHSLNIRAAFLHNVADALASLGVIVAGALIILYDLYVADLLVTVAIAGFVLWHGVRELPRAVRILMGAAPRDVDFDAVVGAMRRPDGVVDVHHVHLWEMDEHRRSLEAHVVIRPEDAARLEIIKAAVKARLRDGFGVHHATLEFEFAGEAGVCTETDPVPACNR